MAFVMTGTLLSSCEEELEQNLRQISIDPTELAFNSGSGSDTVNVTCTSEWSLTGEAEWCKASVNQGNGDAAVIFTVEPNTDSTSARNATFTFLCGDKEAVLTVTQEKMDYYISIDTTELQFSAAGGEDTVIVTCISEWELTGDADWCKASAYQGTGDTSVIFIAEPNADTSGRSATFTFTSGGKEAVLTVTQDEKNYSISIDTTELEFSAAGGEDTVIVTCTAEWELTGDADWCKASAYQGTGDTSVIFIAEPNADTSGRSATFTFTSGGKEAVLTVTQAEKDYSISIDRTELKFGYKGGQLSIVVTSSDNWSLEGSSDWCKASSMSGNNGDSVVFTADPYDNLYENRSASFNFSCGNKTATLTVTQVDDSPIIEFKDQNFLNALLKTYYMTLYTGELYHVDVDINRDGQISEIEAAMVKALDISPTTNSSVMTGNITNIDEISYFTGLIFLTCSGNDLTALDLSKNTELQYLQCNLNQLTSVNISNNPKLINLDCYMNKIQSLDISNNTLLESLSCGDNRLTTLDISNNTEITYLDCSGNALTSLDVSNSHKLVQLICDENQLSSLHIGNITTLENLSCSHNQLKALSVGNNIGMKYLYCSFNEIASLDVSKNTDLLELNCDDNKLKELNTSNNVNLTMLWCPENQLTDIDVSHNTALVQFNCQYNQLTSLDVSKNTALQFLYFTNNDITTIDLSKNVALTSLGCFETKLETLDLSNNIALTELECWNIATLKEIILPANGTYNEQLIQMVLDSDGNYSPDMFKTK